LKYLAYLTVSILFAFLCGPTSAQLLLANGKKITRCATMQRVEKLIQNNVLTKAAPNSRTSNPPSGQVLSTYRLQAVVTVPVVVHIVLPNPYLVTDADVQAQIDRLNLDYAGINPDSTNAPAAFLALRGHSQIQFCLAKRTPDGRLTSGIERRVSSTGSNAFGEDPIKFTAKGGLDQWDPASYLNLWVGDDVSGGDILGYSSFPGMSPANEDGVFINYKSWGGNSCYTIPEYNKGRTATHEIGHYFGLLHIWGDDDGCDGDDFRNLTEVGSSCSLPAGLFNPPGQGNTPADIGDTPNQGSETTNCPSGTVIDSCSKTAPGKMYQNHMDYSLDACLTMFTKKQVERMEWVVDNCRATLKTSLGCQPPVSSVTRDAAPLESVNPGGVELNGCETKTYPSVILCAGAFTPKVRIVNNTGIPLTSVTVGYQLDDGAPVTQTINLNLALGVTTVVSFPSISVTAGNHQVKFFTSNPNGAADQISSNDTLTVSFTVNGTASVPFREDFTGNTFPPPNWSIFNPDGDITWQRSSIGNGNAGSAYMNTFNYEENDEIDDLISPRISYSSAGIDSVKLTFDLAAATYSDPNDVSITMDTLQILVTTDCGNTFTSVYKKWGKELRSVDTPKTDEFFPAPGQWRKESVDLTAFANQSPVQIVFRVINNFENNIFIDNVNLITSAVPALLKKQGYLVLPNPFRQNFAVWFYQPPPTLRAIRVYNAIGQLVWLKAFAGSTSNFITIDLLGRPAGVYIVRTEYQDASKNFSVRVVKY